MRVEIVGNGPSRGLWDGSGWSIGCNKSEDTNLVCIYDRAIVDKLHARKLKLPAPIVLGPNAADHARRVNIWNAHPVVGVVPKPDNNQKVQNAGQAAVLWCLRLGLDEIHLWGFDSLWTNSRVTSTDEWNGQKTTKMAEKWVTGWKLLFKEFPNARLHVHGGDMLHKVFRGLEKFFVMHGSPN